MSGDRAATAVILLGTDTPIGLAVTRDLGKHGHRVIGIGRSASALASHSQHCYRHALRAEGENALIAQIIDLAVRHRACALLAISENDLLMLDRRRAELSEHLSILVPERDALAVVFDKERCSRLAQSVGIRVPTGFIAESAQDAINRTKALEMQFPVVLKWADPPAVVSCLERARIPFIKTDYAASAAELAGKLARYEGLGRFPMVQEYCPGRGMGQMFLADHGETLIEFQHERLHEWPPEGGVSTLCRSVPLSEHAAIRARSRRLLQALNWTGVAMVEYRFDPVTHEYCFLEVNGRFWGSLPLAISAGVPFAAGLVAAIAENRTVPTFARDYPSLTSCYWIPETKRLLRLWFQSERIQDPFFKPDRWRSLWRYMSTPFRPSTRYYVFEFADPAPFVFDVWGATRRLASALLRR